MITTNVAPDIGVADGFSINGILFYDIFRAGYILNMI